MWEFIGSQLGAMTALSGLVVILSYGVVYMGGQRDKMRSKLFEQAVLIERQQRELREVRTELVGLRQERLTEQLRDMEGDEYDETQEVDMSQYEATNSLIKPVRINRVSRSLEL